MAWFDSYRAYDDETLTALANAGLLRRAAKDVEAGKVEWAEQGGESGVIAADGQRVQLDARGPQQACCDCPAPGICKHILGAVLWLRGQESAPTTAADETAPASPPVEIPAGLRALDEILALPPALLFKAAGVAAVRRAAATPVQTVLWQDQGSVLILELPELNAACRWIAGAGFAGMISEIPAAERRAVHLIALAALRREHGCPLPWPEGMEAAPVVDSAALGERERQFLAQVEAMLHELLAGGLAHVSDVTSARLLALNMSARGEGLPRLAALLRNLGGMADLLVRRDHRVHERDALALMARIHALCAALGAAQDDLAKALRGSLRRDFDQNRDEAQALDLLPLGAHWWQTRGGARGLTLAFWDAGAQRLLQAALARPDGSDTGFTRHSAWHTQALWSGAGPAQRVCEGSLRLTQPRLADDGRLALGSVTRAETGPAWPADDPRLATLGCDDWALLAEQLRDATGLAGGVFDTALLRPHASRAPTLDEVQQRFEWPVQDGQGRWLTLCIPCGTEHRARVDNLDRLIARNPAVRGILVRIDRAASACLLVPVAVLVDSAQNTVQAVSLDFAKEPARSTSLVNRILRLFEARHEQPPAIAPPTLAARLLAPVIEVVETQAETGRLALTAAQAAELQEAHARLASVGLDTLAQALDAHRRAPTASALLTLAWLCQLMTELEGLPLPE